MAHSALAGAVLVALLISSMRPVGYIDATEEVSPG
jgi:hypothetical protein